MSHGLSLCVELNLALNQRVLQRQQGKRDTHQPLDCVDKMSQTMRSSVPERLGTEPSGSGYGSWGRTHSAALLWQRTAEPTSADLVLQAAGTSD